VLVLTFDTCQIILQFHCQEWLHNPPLILIHHGVFVKSQKWHDTHFLTLRHNTKIVEFYPTMAAETDSYEDNANELHP
jgi:hypothetical protein